MTDNSNRVEVQKASTTPKNDDMLLTVLARGATANSRKLLKDNGMPDAKNHKDLEQKLAELYIKADDKVALEKKFAEIHPHRAWLLKYIQPKEEPKKIVVEEIKEVKAEHKTNFCGHCGSNMCGHSHFEGNKQQATLTLPHKDYTPLYLISLVAVFGILSLHHLKNKI